MKTFKLALAIIFASSVAAAQSSECALGVEMCKAYLGKVRIDPGTVDLGGRCPTDANPLPLQGLAQAQGYCVTGVTVISVTNGPAAGTWLAIKMYNPQKDDHVAIFLGHAGDQVLIQALQQGATVGSQGLTVTLTSDDQRLASSLDASLAQAATGRNGGLGNAIGSFVNGISPETLKGIGYTVDAYTSAVKSQEMVRRQEEAYQREASYRLDQQNQITVAYANAGIAQRDNIGLALGSIANRLAPRASVSEPDMSDVSIEIDSTTQMRAAQATIEASANRNWKVVARNVNALFDSRLQDASPGARLVLKAVADDSGLIHGPAIGRMGSIVDPGFKTIARVSANWVQAGALAQGRLIENADRRAWVRASVNYYRAGEIALRNHDVQKAFDLFDRAQKVGRALAGSEERNELDAREDLRLSISRGSAGSDAWKHSAALYAQGTSRSIIEWTPGALAFAAKNKSQLVFLQSRIGRFEELGLLGPDAHHLNEIMSSVLNAVNYKITARDLEGVQFLTEVGLKLYDASTYLTPTHFIDDAYALIYSRDFETGRKLSNEERLMHVLNVYLGCTTSVKSMMSMVRIEEQAAANLESRGVSAAEEAANQHLEKMFGDVKFLSAEEVNARMADLSPPFLPGSVVADIKLQPEFKGLVRVHGPSSTAGSWLTESAAVEGLSPSQIQKELSLKFAPTHISDVEILKPTETYRGVINRNFAGYAGAIQYKVKAGENLDNLRFTNTRVLKDL